MESRVEEDGGFEEMLDEGINRLLETERSGRGGSNKWDGEVKGNESLVEDGGAGVVSSLVFGVCRDEEGGSSCRSDEGLFLKTDIADLNRELGIR